MMGDQVRINTGRVMKTDGRGSFVLVELTVNDAVIAGGEALVSESRHVVSYNGSIFRALNTLGAEFGEHVRELLADECRRAVATS